MALAIDTMTSQDADAALVRTLRAGTARAGEFAGGGLALLLGRGRDGGSQELRAAAGFENVDQARVAAAAAEPLVADVTRGTEARRVMPEVSLGARAREGLWIAPLVTRGRPHGALVVGLPSEPSPQAIASLGSLAESMSLRLDHAALEGRLERLESSLASREREQEQNSDEILKLSEALLAQDVELLQNNERLGKIEKLKADFIEKMSRELRTPLNSIIECIISVLAGENENLPESARDSLRTALDEGTVFLRTLQNILDLWRLKQGELPVAHQEVNFREVVEEAIFSVQDTLGDKPVRIEKRVSEPLPKVRTDLAKVNQVLFLLLDNAVKFTTQGTIDIEVAVDQGRLRCEVRDTGIGICADDRQFIFDEFYQVDETRSTVYRGAGLGLTLVRDLLVLLDGQLELESEVGRGTRVRFDIPVDVVG